jgi:hypothetical protein
MSVIAISGKQFTVTVGGKDYSAQVTGGSIEKSGSSETIQTLADQLTVSKGVETKVSCDFLYDGFSGFYAALWTAVGGSALPVIITGGDGKWTGDMVATSISDEFAADENSTCKAEFVGALEFTQGTESLPKSAPVVK